MTRIESTVIKNSLCPYCRRLGGHDDSCPVVTLTLRDKFAMAALTGICMRPDYEHVDFSIMSLMAYNAADAMLAERLKDNQDKKVKA